jgi:hypothetical protein
MLDRHEYTSNPPNPMLFWGGVAVASTAALVGLYILGKRSQAGETEKTGAFHSGPVLADTPPAQPLEQGQWIESFMVEEVGSHKGFGYAVLGEGSGDYLWLIQYSRTESPAASDGRYTTVEAARSAAQRTIDENYRQLTESPVTPLLS